MCFGLGRLVKRAELKRVCRPQALCSSLLIVTASVSGDPKK